jgi:hypothetical protein
MDSGKSRTECCYEKLGQFERIGLYVGWNGIDLLLHKLCNYNDYFGHDHYSY